MIPITELPNYEEVVQNLAEICHEANRVFCKSIGDSSQQIWAKAPLGQKQSAINGVKFHLSADHEPKDSHEAWMKEKEAAGWVYGPVKDEHKRTHPCLVPYSDLPKDQQYKDYLFTGIVQSFKKFYQEVM